MFHMKHRKEDGRRLTTVALLLYDNDAQRHCIRLAKKSVYR